MLIVFAASFFGAFELTLPSKWSNAVDSKAEQTSGLLSIFLMAFTTGLACNIANWKSFASIFSLDIADIQGFEIYLMAATAIATLIMVIVEFKRNGIKFAFSAPVDNTKPTKQLTGVRGGLAMITPLIPIVLVAFLKVPVTPAFTVGIIWCLLFTSQSFSKAMNQMTKTCYDLSLIHI